MDDLFLSSKSNLKIGQVNVSGASLKLDQELTHTLTSILTKLYTYSKNQRSKP